MKISETDGNFWDIIGGILYHEDDVIEWSYNRDKKTVTIQSPGEITVISLKNLNDLLKKKESKIRSAWKTGNNFDGILEDD